MANAGTTRARAQKVALFGAVAAVIAAAAERHRLQQLASRNDDEAEDAKATATSRWCQRLRALLGAWILENGTLLSVAGFMSASGIFPPRVRGHPLKTVVRHVAMSLLITESTWLLQHVYTDLVYRDLPYFGPAKRRWHPTLADFVRSWARLMIPMRIINSFQAVHEVHSLSDGQYAKHIANLDSSGQGLFSFFLQFAVARCLFDIGFYMGHRTIHRPNFYSWIHKKHHEHHEPNVLTNCHFTVVDLFIEASIPFICAFGGLGALGRSGFSLSGLQRNYIIYSFLWYLNGSHAGKPVPYVTMFPPLSFLPGFDETLGGGVAHHHAHHRLVSCNYGIAAWPDKLFGTHRPLPDARESCSERTS